MIETTQALQNASQITIPAEFVTYANKRPCIRCGRPLKNEQSIERGMGKLCWKKSLINQPIDLD